MGIKELRVEIKEFNKKKLNIRPLRHMIEFHRKISISFSSVVFMLLGVGFAGKIRHREKSINIGVCFLAGLGYYFMGEIATTLSFKEILPVAVSMWIPNILFLAIGSYFAYRVYKT